MARRPRLSVLIPVVVVALVGVFALVGVVSNRSGSTATGSQNSAMRSSAAGGAGSAEAVAPSALSSTDKTAGSDTSVAMTVPPSATYSAHHLVRTGDLSLLVARGTLLATVDRITSMTEAGGGYVMSSAVGSETPGVPVPMSSALDDQGSTVPTQGSTASSGSGHPYATLTLRVPEQGFDAAVKRFATLGDVQSVSTSSEDVTSQYVDLQARLRHFRAVEQRLVRFLAATSNVSQMLAVQDRIDKVQLTIEQLSAQLKSMSETTTYGTLSVFLQEKGSTAVVVTSSTTFTGTLWRSVQLLGHGARVTGLVLAALLPFAAVAAVIALAVWYVTRRVRRHRRRLAPPSLPA